MRVVVAWSLETSRVVPSNGGSYYTYDQLFMLSNIPAEDLYGSYGFTLRDRSFRDPYSPQTDTVALP